MLNNHAKDLSLIGVFRRHFVSSFPKNGSDFVSNLWFDLQLSKWSLPLQGVGA